MMVQLVLMDKMVVDGDDGATGAQGPIGLTGPSRNTGSCR